ncbi:MAG TPA: flagellar basal body-associated FliL family protein [Edaphobacter sp.]|jgi:flagellar FliL protein|nr:flagellar basal body-associated FliL family protein [Edaphobacter sp.]
MATTPPVIQPKITSDPVKLPMMPLLIAVVAGVIVATVAVGGVLTYLLRSGKVPIHATAAPPPPPAASVVKTHMVVMEPLLANLADSSGSAYLRVGITLAVADPAGESPKESKKAEEKPAGKDAADPAVRDTVLTILGRETSEQLLAPEGKDRLKREIKDALAAHDSEIKVTDLFFTEFLVQR